ncbi:MAG: esterase [Acidobacteria bacterium]|nr:esterase [Acidobacteriota bacterium]
MRSRLLGKAVSYCVIFPKNYENCGDKFPVLYLLHGLFGRFDNWLTNTKIIEYAADFPGLIICPEGADGWYTDNFERKNHFYESYFFQELIPHAERRFPVRAERNSRAVAGLSMGGYGAFKFAFRRPEMFCFAASMSGAFHAAGIFDDKENEIWKELQPSISAAFGEKDQKTRMENDLLRIIEDFPAEKFAELPSLYFDCGKQDSFLPANQKLNKAFLRRKIAHDFKLFPGGHDWNYWDARISGVLKLAAEKFRA